MSENKIAPPLIDDIEKLIGKVPDDIDDVFASINSLLDILANRDRDAVDAIRRLSEIDATLRLNFDSDSKACSDIGCRVVRKPNLTTLNYLVDCMQALIKQRDAVRSLFDESQAALAKAGICLRGALDFAESTPIGNIVLDSDMLDRLHAAANDWIGKNSYPRIAPQYVVALVCEVVKLRKEVKKLKAGEVKSEAEPIKSSIKAPLPAWLDIYVDTLGEDEARALLQKMCEKQQRDLL